MFSISKRYVDNSKSCVEDPIHTKYVDGFSTYLIHLSVDVLIIT
jgi:hypothetical protein